MIRDDPGEIIVAVTLTRQHHGYSQFTTQDALQIIKAEPR
jgi:hypothetical protein